MFTKTLKMNLFGALYCNQYYKLKEQGKEHTAQKNGTILATVALVLFLFGLFMLLISLVPDFEREMNGIFRKVFGVRRSSGRAIGQIIGLLLFASAYPMVKFTVGPDNVYQRTISYFESLTETEQLAISKKGFQFFISSIVATAIGLLTVMIETYVF